MKSREQVRFCVASVVLVLGISSFESQARADEIVYDFSGTISSVYQSGTPIGGPYSITQGESFRGTFSYNPTTVATRGSANYNVFFDESATISVTIGSTTYAESFLAQNGTPGYEQTVTYDEPSGSSYFNDFEAYAYAISYSGSYQYADYIEANFTNSTSSPLGYLPSTGLPTALSMTKLPIATLDLGESLYNSSTYSYISDFQVEATITDLAMVPEPSSMLMVGLAIGMTGVHCWTRRRRSPRA